MKTNVCFCGFKGNDADFNEHVQNTHVEAEVFFLEKVADEILKSNNLLAIQAFVFAVRDRLGTIGMDEKIHHGDKCEGRYLSEKCSCLEGKTRKGIKNALSIARNE